RTVFPPRSPACPAIATSLPILAVPLRQRERPPGRSTVAEEYIDCRAPVGRPAIPPPAAQPGQSRAGSYEITLPRPALQDAEVAVDLPLRELDAVLVPLLALQPHVRVVDVVAERAPHQVGAGELVDRLAERLREGDDPALATLLRGEVVEVLLHRRLELVTLLDPFEARVEQGREREVRVARRIGTANLGARRLLGAGLVERDPDQR